MHQIERGTGPLARTDPFVLPAPPLVCSLKYCLYGCVCLCGLVAGPTRTAVRHAYKLPVQPPLGDENAAGLVNPDCLTYTIPCTACFALCQESNELRVGGRGRGPLSGRHVGQAQHQRLAATPGLKARGRCRLHPDLAPPTTPAGTQRDHPHRPQALRLGTPPAQDRLHCHHRACAGAHPPGPMMLPVDSRVCPSARCVCFIDSSLCFAHLQAEMTKDAPAKTTA
jgi:hypothetical protein